MAKTPQSHHSCHGRFSRPVNLLEAAPHITSDLLRLPTEILVEIFKGSDSLDRMCLALTCKYMLQVSSLVRIRIPSANSSAR
ncbi:unnamed protein product [Penicillium camemberti]|uniref:Str. FM013 n=1 Tax=Penicillium camemberti (strain FM 013) TaxID=1429867 RepID=A0A0G4PV80_PENC3|nr:unnamed protein product [Penicillium camemberti]